MAAHIFHHLCLSAHHLYDVYTFQLQYRDDITEVNANSGFMNVHVHDINAQDMFDIRLQVWKHIPDNVDPRKTSVVCARVKDTYILWMFTDLPNTVKGGDI